MGETKKSLNYYEKDIEKRLRGKELWGDIDYSLQEYEELRDRLVEVLSTSYIDIIHVCRKYPNCITTFLVFLTRYRYNKYFWRLVEEELQLNSIEHYENEIGNYVKKNFDRHGFDYSIVEGDRRVNMSPILYEGGMPPESCLDDLFYILDYDDSTSFDPGLLIDDLTAGLSYKIRKPLRDFLDRFRGDRAVDFVLEVHDAVICVNHSTPVESKFTDLFSAWKELERTKESINRRKNSEVEVRPHMIFDAKKGLCIVLPKQILKDEFLDEVIWTIERDNPESIIKYVSVFGDEGRRFTETLLVPVSPSSKYRVWLDDNEVASDGTITNPDVVEFIKPDSFVMFNANGRLVNHSYLQYPQSVLVLPENAVINKQENLVLSKLYYPTNVDSYDIYSVEPLGCNARLVIDILGKEYQITGKPRIDFSMEGKTLFSLTDTNLYLEIPDLTISIDDYEDTNGYELRFFNERVDIGGLFEEGKATISLKKWIKGEKRKYGYYSIRLYKNNHFIRQTDFYYVPKIKSNYNPVILWPDGNYNYSENVIRFEKTEDLQLEFPSCTVTTDSKYYYVDYSSEKGLIKGIMRSDLSGNSFSCEFSLPVYPFEFELIDGNGESIERTNAKAYRLGLSDVNDNNYWLRLSLFGEFVDYEYSLQLVTVDGIEQSMKLNKTKKGGANYNLQVFSDTVRNCPLPATISLQCDSLEGSYVVPLISISQAVHFIEAPYYSSKGNVMLGADEPETDITVRRFGREENEQCIPFENSRVGYNKAGYAKRGFKCSPELTKGIYTIESSSKETLFLFEEESEYNITSNNTINVGIKPTDGVNNFSDWLDRLLTDIIKYGTDGNLEKSIIYQKRGILRTDKDAELSEIDYERLVAMIFLLNENCSKTKKDHIRQCISLISAYVLDGAKRMNMIRFLLDINCSEEMFESCVKEYGLDLFSCSNEEAKAFSERIERYSPDLALYMLMQMDAPLRKTLGREKFRDLIGKDAIRSLLWAPDYEDDSLKKEELRRFLREESPCTVKIMLDKEIAGDMVPILTMIEDYGKYIKFNVSKKPDVGIYFYQIRYVDQYVNWYMNTHDRRTWNLYPETERAMINLIKEKVDSIVKAYERLKYTPIETMVKQYQKALRGRFEGDPTQNLNVAVTNRFFYVQGLAAFLAKVPKEYNFGWANRAGESFMIRAFEIAPKMSRRDLMMASTYIYLSRKEEQLCR